jgi:hypothetical protein
MAHIETLLPNFKTLFSEWSKVNKSKKKKKKMNFYKKKYIIIYKYLINNIKTKIYIYR